ncbi:MAG: PH domain-containing protein [Phycisphaerales bacterium]
MPNRYIVHGTDEVTGTPSKKIVEAETAAQAEAIAAKIGLKVTGSEIDTAPPAEARAPAGRMSADAAAEETVWEGTPSLWNLFWWYLSCLLVLPIPYVIYLHMRTKSTRYSLTNQRLRLKTGLIARDFEDIELYRVLDSAVDQSAIDRMLGIGTVVINSSDERQPIVRLERINSPRDVREQLRQLSEARRRWRKVQEIEVQ